LCECRKSEPGAMGKSDNFGICGFARHVVIRMAVVAVKCMIISIQ
jgi:hypothetical protein